MYPQVTDLKDWSQEKAKHTYKAVRVTAENENLPNFKKTKLIKSLEDPTDKGRCDFDKSTVVVTHSFGGIKLEFLEQTQELLLANSLNQNSAEKTKTEKLAVCEALLITQYK